ncbi:MAG: hypothetical protein J0L92_38550 [Deltaproteobacteria bacterium]|nr:hypothetical protein [Deltaproteobacteria bacterium]
MIGRALLLALVSTLFASACAPATWAPGSFAQRRVTATEIDQVLVPGDFLFRYVDPADPLDAQITNAIIQSGQVTVQSTSDATEGVDRSLRALLGEDQSRFEDAFSRGDANAVHVAIYLGGGETAEAFGTSLDDARVALWNITSPSRRGTAWRVVRHHDPRLRASIAEVARRWANGRMGYEPPFEVFVQDARWGAHAREHALLFANAFDREGGPPEIGSMFCSQFAVAALQSASANLYLADEGRLWDEADFDGLPREARVDAVASPLHVFGAWMSSGAFKLVAHVVVE